MHKHTWTCTCRDTHTPFVPSFVHITPLALLLCVLLGVLAVDISSGLALATNSESDTKCIHKYVCTICEHVNRNFNWHLPDSIWEVSLSSLLRYLFLQTDFSLLLNVYYDDYKSWHKKTFNPVPPSSFLLGLLHNLADFADAIFRDLGHWSLTQSLTLNGQDY